MENYLYDEIRDNQARLNVIIGSAQEILNGLNYQIQLARQHQKEDRRKHYQFLRALLGVVNNPEQFR